MFAVLFRDAPARRASGACAPGMQAFSNVLKRLLEANGRGMWQATPEVLRQLKQLYSDMDDELEGVVKRK